MRERQRRVYKCENENKGEEREALIESLRARTIRQSDHKFNLQFGAEVALSVSSTAAQKVVPIRVRRAQGRWESAVVKGGGGDGSLSWRTSEY